MKSLLLVTTLGIMGYTVNTARAWLAPRERAGLYALSVLVILGLTFALYPSDPRTWSLARTVEHLASPVLDGINVLGNTLIGAVLFGLFTWGLYGGNRKR